jgi:hypothetical protein
VALEEQLPTKTQGFFWLLIKGRLSTRNILKRRNMHLDSYYNCALCRLMTEETVRHLFVDCSMATRCWDIIGMDIPLNSSCPELISQLKIQLNSPFFMDAII